MYVRSLRRHLRRVATVTVVALALALTLIPTAPGTRAASDMASSLSVTRLEVNDVDNPLGIDDPRPDLSWQLAATQRDQVQSAYQVLVASRPDLLAAGNGDLWDSGKVSSSQSINVQYAGAALPSRAQAYWTVRVWDNRDRPSAWSKPAHWEMGLLDADDWQACWLTNPQWLSAPESWPTRMPLFAKTFTVDHPIARARLYAVGLGMYEARLNGAKVGDAVLEPANTDFGKRVRYTTYDVTDALQQGNNTLGFMLGNGIYNTPQTPGRYTNPNVAGKTAPLKLIAQLEVTYTDGTRQTITTDPSWRTALGPITFSGWYGGEDYDARLATPGWDTPAADLSSWATGTCTEPPAAGTVLSAQDAPPVRVQQTLTAVSRKQVAPGVWQYDLGRNIAGFPQVTVSGAAGQAVRMSPSEQLLDGRVTGKWVFHDLPVYFQYTPATDDETTWHPRFSYTGFRWIEISGLDHPLPIDAVQALVLYADNTQAGSFESSDVMLNQIHDLFLHSLESNMYSELTDCPTREKFGWNEQRHLLFNGLAANFDVAAYYRQLMQNVVDDQLPNGDIPRLTPNYRDVNGHDPWWSSVVIQAPWKMYQAYGDIQTLRETYPAMQRYLAYLNGQANGYILENANGYGDWIAPDASTPFALTGTVAYYQAVDTLAKIATVLGDTDAAASYNDLAANIRTAFNARFFDPASGSYGSGSQASNALPLAAGMVPAADRSMVLNHIIDDIRSRDNHLSTGEMGLRGMLDALGDAGRADVVLDMALNATVPSTSGGDDVNSGYAGMVLGTPVAVANESDIPWTGQTTMTEGWNPTGGSRNHIMLGAIDDWYYRYLAGITQDAPGFRQFTVAPEPAGSLSHVRAAWPSPYGQIVSEWWRHGSTFQMNVDVPVNTSATIAVPFADKGAIDATGGADLLRVDGDHAFYSVGSGHWTFTVDTGQPVQQNKLPVYVGRVSDHVQVLTDPTWTGQAEFRLHNLGDTALTVRPELTASAGLTASLATTAVTIPANGSIGVKAAVSAAEGAGAGEGSLTLRVEDSAATVPVTTLDTDDLVRLATMTASSSHSGHPPSGANNGDTSSDTWNAGNGWNDGTQSVWPDWLAAQWDQSVTVGRIRVFTLDSKSNPAASYGLEDFDIQVLVDGQWTTVDAVRGNTAGVVEARFDPVTTTGVRVFVQQSHSAWSRVVELEAYRS